MSSAIKPKHQRLVLIVFALIALVGAGLLAAYALKNQAAYFYAPSELVAKPPETGRAIRLGGMVERGSIKTMPDGVTINFLVSDGKAKVPVRFTGITPELFVEGSGVVAEGRMAGTTFVADNLLAKHDEKYVPREMKNMTTAEAKAVIAETK